MANEFRSRFFSLGFLEGEQLEAFKRDIILLNRIEPSNWNDIIDDIKKVIVAKTEKEEINLYEEIIKKGLLNNHQMAISSHRIISYFFKKFSDYKIKEDNTPDILEDIKSIVKEDELNPIKILVETARKESPWYESYKKQSAYDSGLLPFLTGIGTTVELRGIFNREIKYGESFGDYKKEVEIIKENSVVPTITIALTLDSGNPNRFCLQASPEKINWLIEELRASLYKVELLEETYKTKK